MIDIDARGFGCPIPVVKAKKAMDKHPGQAIAVLVETAVSRENLTRLAGGRKYGVKVEETGESEYRIVLTPPSN